jgi:hypothetical protein
MPEERASILESLAAEAIRLGFNELEVEYDDGRDQIYAQKDGFGLGIASLPSEESLALRTELSVVKRRKREIVVDGVKVELRATSFHSFGETAYRVELRRVDKVSPKKKR